MHKQAEFAEYTQKQGLQRRIFAEGLQNSAEHFPLLQNSVLSHYKKNE